MGTPIKPKSLGINIKSGRSLFTRIVLRWIVVFVIFLVVRLWIIDYRQRSIEGGLPKNWEEHELIRKGKLLWDVKLKKRISSRITINSSRVLFEDESGGLNAIDINTGAKRSLNNPKPRELNKDNAERNTPEITPRILPTGFPKHLEPYWNDQPASLCYNGKTIATIVGGDPIGAKYCAYIYMLDPSSDELVWQLDVGRAVGGALVYSRFEGPVLGEDKLFISYVGQTRTDGAYFESYLLAIGISDGNLEWSILLKKMWIPRKKKCVHVVDDKYVLFEYAGYNAQSFTQGFACAHANSGKPHWYWREPVKSRGLTCFPNICNNIAVLVIDQYRIKGIIPQLSCMGAR